MGNREAREAYFVLERGGSSGKINLEMCMLGLIKD
jgi:hypothetical protein